VRYSQRELALQNLKYLRRAENDYQSIELLEDENVFEWDESKTPSELTRQIQKAYLDSHSKGDLSKIY
jgi:hypothetical protein